MRSDNAGNWRCCLPDTLILCFLQKLLLFGNRICPEYRLTAQLGRDFQPTLLAPVLHLHRLAAAFNDGLLSSSQSFFFITCFYEAGMRMHSDAIDYKTRIAALSSGMGRFSWSDAIRKLTFSGFFFMINVIQFFLNVFFCRLYYIVGFLSDWFSWLFRK